MAFLEAATEEQISIYNQEAGRIEEDEVLYLRRRRISCRDKKRAAR